MADGTSIAWLEATSNNSYGLIKDYWQVLGFATTLPPNIYPKFLLK